MQEFLALSHRWHEEERRKDSRVALLAFVTASTLGAKGPGGRALKLSDFMPGEGDKQESEGQSAEELEAILMSMVNNQ